VSPNSSLRRARHADKPGAASLYFTIKSVVDKICKGDVKDAKEGDLVLLLEDDMALHPDWKKRFEVAVAALEKEAPNWTLGRLGSWGDQRREDLVGTSGVWYVQARRCRLRCVICSM